MASAGIRRLKSGRYKLYWRLDDYSQGSETHATKEQAREAKADLLAQLARGTWVDPRRGKVVFDEWADEWWETYRSDPDRSPTTLESADSRLRCHLRPYFGPMQLRAVSVMAVRRWQNELRGKVGYGSVMACRSLLYRILQAAVDDRRIETNPVDKVPPPKRPVDPEKLLGHGKPRVQTPEEFGRFLAAAPRGCWDVFVTLLGTGMRAGEFCGLRAFRVDLTAERIDVVSPRFDAGRFGRGYRPHTKTPSGVRPIPLAATVTAAIRRQLPDGRRGDALVFTAPGGKALTRYRLRHLYLAVAGIAELGHLDLRGPHDLRHTFATWLEDAGIPARVIDEVMGHRDGRRGEDAWHGDRGSAIGKTYRHTTPEMGRRVREAIDYRLKIALRIAEQKAGEHAERRVGRPILRPWVSEAAEP